MNMKESLSLKECVRQADALCRGASLMVILADIASASDNPRLIEIVLEIADELETKVRDFEEKTRFCNTTG